ncbi:MAG: hypothetical protein ACK4RV_02290 [Caulobacter sp.]
MQPDTPRAPRPAPPPPTVNDVRIAAEENDTLRRRKGRASTFMSNSYGRSAGGVAVKMLMGQGA